MAKSVSFFTIFFLTFSFLGPPPVFLKTVSFLFKEPKPDAVGEIYPSYFLFTKAEQSTFCEFFKYKPRPIVKGDLQLQDEDELIVIAHGWLGDLCSSDSKVWNSKLVNNLLDSKTQATKILFVDWKEGARGRVIYPYGKPASNAKVIGAVLANFLMADPSFNPTSTHCIGFSLGAHVCSFAGKQLRAKLHRAWGRLTALDPAASRFHDKMPHERLSIHDGDFVDVYHSSTVGLSFPVGHLDVFINDIQEPQPGCMGPSSFGRCSHLVAAKFFARSVLFGNRANSSCYWSGLCECTNNSSSANFQSPQQSEDADSSSLSDDDESQPPPMTSVPACSAECQLKVGYFANKNYKHGRINIFPSEYCWW